ncbi:MAG TPA: hypothetical protein VNV41_02665 [Candidatus Acidoferrales bacterium]|jgi:hypothetical protein|nr:hypothetical protein [Candidatus Acidoferrales bacterium]
MPSNKSARIAANIDSQRTSRPEQLLPETKAFLHRQALNRKPTDEERSTIRKLWTLHGWSVAMIACGLELRTETVADNIFP